MRGQNDLLLVRNDGEMRQVGQWGGCARLDGGKVLEIHDLDMIDWGSESALAKKQCKVDNGFINDWVFSKYLRF